MKRTLAGILVLGGLLAIVLALTAPVNSQPPDKDKGPKDKGPRGKGRRGKGPPMLVMPPFVRDKLELTKDQEKKLADLEKECRGKLKKILTEEQYKQFEEAMRRGPGGRGRPGRPPEDKDGKGPPRRPPDEDQPERPAQGEVKKAPAGIQWFATWQSGLNEARRTGRPILLVSAAPHCAGVSGIW
jgi:hypothetical protein